MQTNTTKTTRIKGLRSTLTTLLFLAAVGVAPSLHAAPGDLDSSFGTGGLVTTDVAGNADRGYSIAIQSDGYIVVAGYANPGSYDGFAVARYASDGFLDPSFGTGGLVTTDMSGNSDQGRSIAIQADGKIVVAGYAYDSGYDSFALARYNADGSLDISFGTGGKVTTDMSGNSDRGHSVAIQSNGKIVVAGYAYDSGYDSFAIARYNSDGSLDTSFATDGKVITDIAGNSDQGHSLVIDGDGKIVVAGHASAGWDDFALARYIGDTPTIVTLSSFVAMLVSEKSGAILEWETGAEEETVGFYLWRATSLGAGYKKINEVLIPSKGNLRKGASYRFVDVDCPSASCFYSLEELDTKGVSNRYGPVKTCRQR